MSKVSHQARFRDAVSGLHKFARKAATQVGESPPAGTTVIPNPRAGLRLVAAAIKNADGVHSRGFRSHSQIRAALGYNDHYNPWPGDIEGFLTSEDQFVTRRQALQIAVDAGQVSPSWLHCTRALLSSDINWGD